MSDAVAISPRLGGADEPNIESELAEVAGILNAQHGRLVSIVERALGTGEWQQSEIHSPGQWLAWKTGLSPHRAKEIVACAERSRELPKIHAALTRGELAIDQAIAANRAPAWADARIADFARVQTVAQLRRTITKQFFDEGGPEPVPDESPAEESDRLSTRIDDDGSWRISGVGDVARGSIIDAALAEAKNSLFERGQTDATWFDALVEISQRSLDAVESPTRRDRYRIWIHLDADMAAASTTDGWRIPQPIRDQLLCDGVVQPVWERNGVPFNVGRSQRIVPDRTRRIIERRDGGCRVPGCTNSQHVEIHHIIHWLNGGMTDTWNLLSLCGKHHRLHHHHKLGITGNADQSDGIAFTDAHGRALDPCGKPIIPTRPPPKPEADYEHPVGGRMNYHYFAGWVHPDILKARRNRPLQ